MTNNIFVFIGTSGVGKTFYSKHLERKYGFKRVYAVTTRSVRPTHPDEYIHVTKPAFEEMVKNGEMLEYTEFNDNYYGRRKKDLIDSLSKHHVVIDMTTDRISKLKEYIPEAVVIHLSLPEPIIENTLARVKDRNWSEEEVAKRLKIVQAEMKEIIKARAAGLVDHSITTIEGDPTGTLALIDEVLLQYFLDSEVPKVIDSK